MWMCRGGASCEGARGGAGAQAYWARIRQLHPDLAGEGATAAMVEVNLAYDLLTQARSPVR